MSLKEKSISSMLWTLAERFGTQGTSFLVNIVLTRVLLPTDYGLIGMISIFMSVGYALMDSGLTSSLIRTKEATQLDYSTVFFINIVGSCIIYTLIFFTAPLIAGFYNQPQLTDIIRVYSLGFILTAFSAIQQTRMTKEMNFKMQLYIRMPSIVLSGILGIGMAYSGFGVWSLVYMYLANQLLASIQFWWKAGWMPSFIFDRAVFRKHFMFGYKMTLSGLLNTIFSNIYHVVIGKVFSADLLGFYTRAVTLKHYPVSNISTALNKVTFPLFAQIQDDPKRLKAAYKRLMQQVVFWVAPLLIGAAVLAEPLFVFLFTERWLPAVPYFQLLCISGILYPLHSYNLNVLKVFGRSDLFLSLEVVKRVMTLISILITVWFGIIPLIIGQVVNSYISFWINSRYSGKFIGYPALEQVRDISLSMILALVMGTLVYFSDQFLWVGVNLFIRLTAGVILGLTSYILLSMWFKAEALAEAKSLLLSRVFRRK